MSYLQQQATQFEALKKANSPWLSLESGESARITQLRSMKALTKTDDKTGVTSAVMAFEMDVETEEGLKVKKLNTSSSKLINTFIENGIDVGSAFVLTKHGESFSTTYVVTEVVNRPKSAGTQGAKPQDTNPGFAPTGTEVETPSFEDVAKAIQE